MVVICHSRRQGGIIGQLLSQSVRKHKFADNDFFPDRTFFIGREGNGSRIEWNHTYWENWVANGENYPTYDFNDIDFELSFLPEEFVVNCKNRTECVEAQKLLWGDVHLGYTWYYLHSKWEGQMSHYDEIPNRWKDANLPIIPFTQFKQLKMQNTYTLIKVYPGHTSLGETTTEDFSAFPEFWELQAPLYKDGDKVIITIQGETQIYPLASPYIKGDSLFWKDEDNVDNCYPYAKLRLATDGEITEYERISIQGYTAAVKEGMIAFGCQHFSKLELESYRALLNRVECSAILTIHGKNITVDLLDKLLKKLG